MDRDPCFSYFTKNTFKSHTANMATFIVLRHPVAILVTAFNNPDNLTNDVRALTLVGPTMDNSILDPLAVLHLDN